MKGGNEMDKTITLKKLESGTAAIREEEVALNGCW